MTPKAALVTALCATGLLAATAANAAVVLRMPLDDLVRNADLVVRGEVTKAKAYMDKEEGRIYTVHTFKVAQTLKGKATEEIEVVTMGGELEDIGQLIPGSARLLKGQEAVLCLQKVSAGFAVVGMAQGKFVVDRGKPDLVTVKRDLKGLHFVGQGKDQQQADEMPLATFEEMVRRATK